MIARANSILQTRVLLALWPGLLASCSIAWAGEAVLEADFHSRWAKRVFAETAPAPPRNRLRVVHEEEPGGLSRAWEVGSELPFSFVYDAKPSRELLGNWKRTVCKEPIDPVRRRIVLTLADPATGLELRAEAILYLDTPGVEWTLHFTNKGAKPSALIEQVKAVDVAIRPGLQDAVTLHRLAGNPRRIDDWLPLADAIRAGQDVTFGPDITFLMGRCVAGSSASPKAMTASTGAGPNWIFTPGNRSPATSFLPPQGAVWL